MLELRFIRENFELVKEKTAKRGTPTEKLDEFLSIDQKRLDLLNVSESLKNQRNTASKEIAELKKGSDEDKAKAEPLILEMREISAKIKELDNELNDIQEQLQDIVMSIPNLLHDSVPVGQDDTDNLEIKKWGKNLLLTLLPKITGRSVKSKTPSILNAVQNLPEHALPLCAVLHPAWNGP